MSEHKFSSPETTAVHAGIDTYEYGPVVPPIYQTSTFTFRDADHGADLFAGKGKGYIYSRMGNPTVEAMENSIAALEGGYGALACGSGMAAVHTVLASMLSAGDHLICSDAVYGPTCVLVDTILTRFGIECTIVDTSDLKAVEAAMKPNTKVVYVETPGNPTLVVTDLEAICKLSHKHGAQVVVDNTFCGPILQRPFEFGADVVLHSLTKSLNGHADVVGGVVVTRDEKQQKHFRKMLNHFGGVLPPMECFLVHRGIKTLALRMKQHCENAMQVAKFLEQCPAVNWVSYPFLASHPQYEIAKKQMSGGGPVISFEVKGGFEAGKTMMNHVKLHGLAVSLGGVESLIQHPASMTHASMGKEARERAGIADGLVRVSVGIECVDDVIADLKQALAAVTKLSPNTDCGSCPQRKAESGAKATAKCA